MPIGSPICTGILIQCTFHSLNIVAVGIISALSDHNDYYIRLHTIRITSLISLVISCKNQVNVLQFSTLLTALFINFLANMFSLASDHHPCYKTILMHV